MAPIDKTQEAKELICDLCSSFYKQGWVSGTGGGISIKVDDTTIVMAPSGVQKERMLPTDMFVLDGQGAVVEKPQARAPPYEPPKLSECGPLFMAAYELRNAGAVMHSHAIEALLATVLDEHADKFSVTHLEMMKGISGHGYYDNCIIPIIENTARECELTDRLRQAILDYPKANAVLVRRHGVYIWGKNWIEAKTQAECYHYLFDTAVKLHQLGIRASLPPTPKAIDTRISSNGFVQGNGIHKEVGMLNKKKRSVRDMPKAIVLDIEGTIAPISFVTEVLFPYAKSHLQAHLTSTFESQETQEDIDSLRKQAIDDETEGINVTMIPEDGTKDEIIAACVANVHKQMENDRKTIALKLLQGHIWRAGYQKGELKGDLFPEVSDILREWRDLGIKSYIYSSGSREAQRLLFANTKVGDLRPYLLGFFDTTFGSKVQAESYKNIGLSIGMDHSQDILFITDRIGEARAAYQAGWKVQVAVREGNPPLEDDHGFQVVYSMKEVLDYFT